MRHEPYLFNLFDLTVYVSINYLEVEYLQSFIFPKKSCLQPCFIVSLGGQSPVTSSNRKKICFVHLVAVNHLRCHEGGGAPNHGFGEVFHTLCQPAELLPLLRVQ